MVTHCEWQQKNDYIYRIVCDKLDIAEVLLNVYFFGTFRFLFSCFVFVIFFFGHSCLFDCPKKNTQHTHAHKKRKI